MAKGLSRSGDISIRVKQRGGFKNAFKMLKDIIDFDIATKLHRYGARGVEALRIATPRDTGLTAESWRYQVSRDDKTGGFSLTWFNDNLDKYKTPIVVLIQYGHATKSGGYVEGRDFINPAIAPILDEMSNEIWKEVTSSRG